MANANAPFGLLPVNAGGVPWIASLRTVYVPAAQTSNIFAGDPVVALGGGDASGCPSVGLASAGAGNPILGVMIGIVNGPASGGGNALFPVTFNSTTYRQASVGSYIAISDDPNQVFAVQEDSNGGAIAYATGAFANGNLVAGSGGNTTYGMSSWMLQSSSVSSSANTTYQVKLLGLQRSPDNAIGAYAKWLVRFNNPQLWSNTGV